MINVCQRWEIRPPKDSGACPIDEGIRCPMFWGIQKHPRQDEG